MTTQVLGAVTEFDRDLLIERTQSDLKRAKAEGKTLRSPQSLRHHSRRKDLKAEGMSQSEAASEIGIGITTVTRHWNRT